MPHVVLADAANEDIVSILEWTHENFGEQARLRYEALLTQAIIDIAKSPDRPGCVAREELAADARTYHLWHSRNRVKKTLGVVSKPRHFLLFRINAQGDIEIGRVLHDSMDLASSLPSDYLGHSSEQGTVE
ncbi:MAG: type II toxin-antitoxin system RelE/ParE family toxin [Pirellula sp.]|jgi:toxin ParE1/3/4|nr:type II toxin-antitoxin system RelE/ParE family toxin [Pirellula sp.]